MSRLLINEPPLQVLPSLAVKIGLQEAIVLQQVHYWLQAAKPKNGERWVYNTYEQWAEQFPFWSPEAIRKIFKSLRDQGLIVSRPRGHHAFDRVNEYTINRAALESLHPEKSTGSCGECIPDEPEKFTASERTNLPATRQETTQETTSREPPLPPKGEARKRADDLKPSDVSPQVWSDWLALRKAKKAAVTATAIDGIKREAQKAGMTLQAALEACCANGWQGFKAEWLQRQQAGEKPGKPQASRFDSIDYREGINDDGSF